MICEAHLILHRIYVYQPCAVCFSSTNETGRLRRTQLACTALLTFTSSALAIDDRLISNLRKLDPELRLEQACDLEAMNQLGQRGFAADRAKSNVSSLPQHSGDVFTAAGGAVRARGNHLSFVCKATPDHLQIKSFRYDVGKEIPESKWSSLDLWR
jgi:hypothetical protein